MKDNPTEEKCQGESSRGTSNNSQNQLAGEGVKEQKVPPLVPPKPCKLLQNYSSVPAAGDGLNNDYHPVKPNQSFGETTDDEMDKKSGEMDNLPMIIPKSSSAYPLPSAKLSTGSPNLCLRGVDVEFDLNSVRIGNHDQIPKETDKWGREQQPQQPQQTLREAGDSESLILPDVINQAGPDFGSGPKPLSSVTSLSFCPFLQFHHKNPCHLLSITNSLADNDKNKYLRIDDLSSKLEHRVRFIVENLDQLAGFWPLLFLERLNKLIVQGDESTLQACLVADENFILNKLIVLYLNERRCSMIFRYWCLWYNIIRRNLVCLPVLAKSELYQTLKMDLVTCISGKCRCTRHQNEPQVPNDPEHCHMSLKFQTTILGMLLIQIQTAEALVFLDGFPEENRLREEKIFIETIFRAVCDIHTDLKPRNLESTVAVEKNILLQLLVSANIKFQTSIMRNLIVEVLEENRSASNVSEFRDGLLTILLQEIHLLKKGYLTGITALFPSNNPLGIQLLGVSGPLKLIIDILSRDFDFFELVDLDLIANAGSEIYNFFSKTHVCNDFVTEVKSQAQQLQVLVQRKFCKRRLQLASEEGSEKITASSNNNKQESDEGDSKSRDIKSKRLSSKTVMWPLDVMLRMFGCKRSNTVSPVLDISYLQ